VGGCATEDAAFTESKDVLQDDIIRLRSEYFCYFCKEGVGQVQTMTRVPPTPSCYFFVAPLHFALFANMSRIEFITHQSKLIAKRA
jgi:hypothetical protein